MKRSLRVALGFLVSGVFLYFALRGQDFGQIKRSLSEAKYIWLLPALLVYFTGVLVRSFRWSVLLRPVVVVSAREVLPVTVVGFMANNVLPLRTGELVRAYIIGSKFGVRKTSALATIAVERLFDGLTLLGFILISAIFVDFTSDLRHVAIVAFFVFSIALIGVVVLTVGGSFRDRVMQVVLGPMPTPLADRVERLAESFLSGLGVMRRKRDLLLVIGSSLLAWSFEVSAYFLVSRAFGEDIKQAMGIAETLLTTGVGNLATLVPSSPGYVGPFEAAVVLVLHGALGVTRAHALSYAIVLHAMLYFPITIWGGIEWVRMQLSLSKIQEIAIEPEELEPGEVIATTTPEPAGGVQP